MAAAQVFFCLMIVFSGCLCQVFSFTGNVSYSQWCGRWTVVGSMALTPGQITEYGSEVTIQTATGNWGEEPEHTTRRVCVIDLTRPPSESIAPAGDMCGVITQTGDVYTIGVSRQLQASEPGLLLQAVLRYESAVGSTSITTNLGRLPAEDPATSVPALTYQIGDGQVQDFGSNNSVHVAVCKNRFVPVRFCGANSSEGSVLKIYANGQETKSHQVCVETGYRLNASDTTERTIKFEYEDSVCFGYRDFIATVIEQPASECDVATPEETTPINACIGRPGSPARQIARLSDGSDVMCDTQTAGGNWIVFQRRNSSDVDFYRDWADYTAGFGDLNTNFWLGLDKIHAICGATDTCELRVDIRFKGENYQATYQDFYLEGPAQKFRLHVGSYCGDAGDAFASIGNGNYFSTKDRDHDTYGLNCAQSFTGAWWYSNCHDSNLNGAWGSTAYAKGLNWHPTTGYYDSVTMSEMKFRLLPQ